MAKTQEEILQEIETKLPTNGRQQISAADLRSVLNDIAALVGVGYAFMGVAKPSTSPGTPDQDVFYIGGAGTYTHFGSSSVTVASGSLGVFMWKGSAWICESISIGGGGSYTLPVATAQVLGGVKIGSGINVALDGTISVSGGGGSFPSVIVDKYGQGDYTTIQAAVNGTTNGAVILIMPGEYEEDVQMFGKERYLVGFCREKCILKNGTGNYDTPPLEASIGGVYNMTIIADNYNPTITDPTTTQVRPGYGIHIEYSNSSAYSFTVQNCKVISKWSAAIGAGVRYNQTVNIINCELVSYCEKQWSIWASKYVEMGGLFFHNDAENTGAPGTGLLNCINTVFAGKTATLTMESLDNSEGSVSALFIGCSFKSDKYINGLSGVYRFNTDNSIGSLCGYKLWLRINSYGNNYSILNNDSDGVIIPTIHLIEDLFTDTGYWEFDDTTNTITLKSSANWKYKVFSVDDIESTNALVASYDWSNVRNVKNIPIIYLDGSDPLTANVVGIQYGVDGSRYDEVNHYYGRGTGYVSKLNIPKNATHIIIQNNAVLAPYTEVVMKYKSIIPIRPTRVDNIVNTFTETGFFEHDDNTGHITLNSSANWKYKVFSVDELISTNAMAATVYWYNHQAVKDIPPIIYLSGSNPNDATVLGVQYSPELAGSSGIAAFAGPLNPPAETTHVVVQNNSVLGSDQTVTVYTDI